MGTTNKNKTKSKPKTFKQTVQAAPRETLEQLVYDLTKGNVAAQLRIQYELSAEEHKDAIAAQMLQKSFQRAFKATSVTKPKEALKDAQNILQRLNERPITPESFDLCIAVCRQCAEANRRNPELFGCFNEILRDAVEYGNAAAITFQDFMTRDEQTALCKKIIEEVESKTYMYEGDLEAHMLGWAVPFCHDKGDQEKVAQYIEQRIRKVHYHTLNTFVELYITFLNMWSTQEALMKFALKHTNNLMCLDEVVSCYVQKEAYAEAIQVCKKVLEQQKNTINATAIHERLLQLYVTTNEKSRILHHLETLLRDPHVGHAYYDLYKQHCPKEKLAKNIDDILFVLSSRGAANDALCGILIKEKRYDTMLTLCKKHPKCLYAFCLHMPKSYEPEMCALYKGFLMNITIEGTYMEHDLEVLIYHMNRFADAYGVAEAAEVLQQWIGVQTCSTSVTTALTELLGQFQREAAFHADFSRPSNA